MAGQVTDLLAGGPGSGRKPGFGTKEDHERERSKQCGVKGCMNRGKIPHIHPDDKLYPHGLSERETYRIYGPEEDYETGMHHR